MDMSVQLMWRKSSFSADKNCVEVAWPGGGVAIRDSKNPDGDPITIPTSVFWQLHESLRRVER